MLGVISMFQVGDHLIYGLEGVCRVTAVGPLKRSGVRRDRLYYTLAPLGRQDAIYIPVDSPVFMRAPLEREALEALLDELPALELCADLPADAKQLAPYYQEIIQSHDFRRVMQLYKTLLCKQRQLSGSRRSLSVTDMRHWKQTETLLCGEIGYVLGVSHADAVLMLRELAGREGTPATPAP